jgi:nucleoside 2-deoxyribosyltransferase
MEKYMGYKCYLAGSIRGLSFEETTKWRVEASEYLGKLGIECISPMRNKDLIAKEEKISDSYNMAGYTPADIFKRDKFDIMHSDIILVNLLHTKHTPIGTTFELAWGFLLDKYCVVVVDKESIFATHPFVIGSGSIQFSNMDEALKYIGDVFGKK